jgi:hypothetical protein
MNETQNCKSQFSRYDKEAIYFDEAVRKGKRQHLESRILNVRHSWTSISFCYSRTAYLFLQQRTTYIVLSFLRQNISVTIRNSVATMLLL